MSNKITYLGFFCLGAMLGVFCTTVFFTSHTEKIDIKVGQIVNNGYCKGQVAELIGSSVKIINAKCGSYTYNYVIIRLSEF